MGGPGSPGSTPHGLGSARPEEAEILGHGPAGPLLTYTWSFSFVFLSLATRFQRALGVQNISSLRSRARMCVCAHACARACAPWASQTAQIGERELNSITFEQNCFGEEGGKLRNTLTIQKF